LEENQQQKNTIQEGTVSSFAEPKESSLFPQSFSAPKESSSYGKETNEMPQKEQMTMQQNEMPQKEQMMMQQNEMPQQEQIILEEEKIMAQQGKALQEETMMQNNEMPHQEQMNMQQNEMPQQGQILLEEEKVMAQKEIPLQEEMMMQQSKESLPQEQEQMIQQQIGEPQEQVMQQSEEPREKVQIMQQSEEPQVQIMQQSEEPREQVQIMQQSEEPRNQEQTQVMQQSEELREPEQAQVMQQSEEPPRISERQEQQYRTSWNLPEQAAKWCRPTEMNPLPYTNCDHEGTFNSIQFLAGLTNGLKMMLLSVIESFQQNRCFFVLEENNHLLIRDDKSQALDTFLGRYFEPIGLSQDDPLVKRAKADGRVESLKWQQVWDDGKKRRINGLYHNITSLGFVNIESTLLKRVMLERMWRLLPQVRENSCISLEVNHGLSEEYLAFSVRRGDKDTEGFEFTNPENYIEASTKVINDYFDGKVPKIFVATDDCSIMSNFRELKPEWNFVSECDRSDGHSGFILADMKHWTLEQTDEHFRKFFVEVLGLAGAKYYIGVAYTNVAWWAHYMRPHRWSHLFLDTNTENTLNNW